MRKDTDFERFQEKRSAQAARENAVPSTARQTTLDKLKQKQTAKPTPAPKPEQPPHVPAPGSCSDATRSRALARRREYEDRQAAIRESEIEAEQTALLKQIANTASDATSKAVHAIFGREPERADAERESLVDRERAAWDRVANFDFRKSSSDEFRKANAEHQAVLAELKQHDEGNEQ